MCKPEEKNKEPLWKPFGVVNSSSLKMITCHTQVKFYASNVYRYRSRAKYEHDSKLHVEISWSKMMSKEKYGSDIFVPISTESFYEV